MQKAGPLRDFGGRRTKVWNKAPAREAKRKFFHLKSNQIKSDDNHALKLV